MKDETYHKLDTACLWFVGAMGLALLWLALGPLAALAAGFAVIGLRSAGP